MALGSSWGGCQKECVSRFLRVDPTEETHMMTRLRLHLNYWVNCLLITSSPKMSQARMGFSSS